MKTTRLVLLALTAAIALPALAARPKKSAPLSPWEQADSIVAAIKRTSFPDRSFSITDFGALASVDGRPTQLAHDAINTAIAVCSQSGGGTVLVPDSTYITGPITLLSNVNLHLADGAVLKFSTDYTLYYPAVLTRWEGIDCYNAHPLVYAYGATNVALTGKGTLDAQGSNDNWWAMCGAKHYGWVPGKIAQKNGARAQLLRWGEQNTPVHQRVFGPLDGMRPQLVNFNRCSTVLIEDVTLLNSPFWVIHPLFTDDLIVRGVTVNNDGPNGDGCDPESCNRVLIEGCTFNTGDDCIAIKSGRNNDGRRWGVPSQNIVVRKCHMANGHGGIVIGSEISGGYRNLYCEDCTMDSPRLDRVVRIKTSSCRGGIIENVYVRNIEVGQCKEAVLRINLDYESREACERGYNPTVRNVSLENVHCKKSRYGVVLIGLEDLCNIYNVRIKDSSFDGVTSDGHLTTGKFRDVLFDGLTINGRTAENLPDQE